MAAELQLALQAFAEKLTKNFATATVNPAQAEDQLKAPTVELFELVGSILDLDVVALAAPDYAERFAEELEVPGPRVPLTRDRQLFDRAVGLGRRLIWLHTYGERFVPDGERAGVLPPGAARATRPIPAGEDDYPAQHSYDAQKRELHVGAGVFAPVAPSVRAYSVSGLDVIGSWLDYRMRDGAGRRSSRLDLIRPAVWPAEFTEELLRLLWIVEATVELQPELDELLGQVVASETIPPSELPEPTDEERRPPG